MTGTELRYRLGAYYAAQEERNGVPHGLLATCHRLAIPVFVGAPADGSVFLNSMKLWAMQKAGLSTSTGSISICTPRFSRHARIIVGDCSSSPAKALATLILGGGVPKNYNLQPEPALGQVLGLPRRARVSIRCADCDCSGHRWVAVFLSAGRGGDVGQSG